MKSTALILGVLLGGCTVRSIPPTPPTSDLTADRAAVDSVLTRLHRAAAEGAWQEYFALYAPEAVFLGTDAHERWELAAFRRYAAASQGWTYQPSERHVFVAPTGRAAWFDERLQNDSYGETRGTGVLLKGPAGWRVVQYNLSLPIPNELAGEVVARIRGASTPP